MWFLDCCENDEILAEKVPTRAVAGGLFRPRVGRLRGSKARLPNLLIACAPSRQHALLASHFSGSPQKKKKIRLQKRSERSPDRRLRKKDAVAFQQ